MRLNKVNLCWVLSDGRKGHEIQSMAVANQVSQHTKLMPFHLKQPWLSFTPRIIPGMNHGIIWHESNEPDFHIPPDLIITTGRQAAAVGKLMTQTIKFNHQVIKHIQILNPKDNATNYDLLLTPEHDRVSGPNVISYTGSIHPYNERWFVDQQDFFGNNSIEYAVILGNPHLDYFKKKFSLDIMKIREFAVNTPLLFCGSSRLSNKAIKLVQEQLTSHDLFWFNEYDGHNPYQQILATGKHIFVTADSINMMNECAASDAAITLLAKDFTPSKKHHRFISSLDQRWSNLEKKPIIKSKKVPYALDQILSHLEFQKLLNSPFSSSSG